MSDRNNKRAIHLVAAASALGAPNRGCADGPETLLQEGLPQRLAAAALRVAGTEIVKPRQDESLPVIDRLAEFCTRVARQTRDIVAAGELPLVLAGDHSCAVGTWSGISRGLQPRGALGMIWIDAHMDSHTPATTESGAWHGMPLAALLGFGEPALTDCLGAGPKLSPQHVCLIGVRSFESGEAALLARLGVRIFHMEEIERRGLDTVMSEALAIARNGTAGFGVSLDIDAIDPHEAPGVGTPAAGGIGAGDMRSALLRLGATDGLVGFELAEYDPHRYRHQRTGKLALDLVDALFASAARDALFELEDHYGANIYDALPVMLVRGEGAWVWDQQDRRYLDMMSAYSAVSHGHAHPRLTRALAEQAGTLAVTSRAYRNNRLPLLLRRLCEITGLDQALPVNTGLEAVEAALKTARRWAYRVKGVAPDRAQIIACRGNFHGRSISIISMSSEAQYRQDFGPLTPGFTLIPYGDARALEHAITEDTAAFIVEPIQGEGGIIVPPPGYLAECARICRRHDVLLIVDEIQTGLGRTGKMFAYQHEDVLPDGVVIGKALGGGLLPVSAFVATRNVMRVLTPGAHGSTFGGNPLACAVALEAIQVLADERLVERSAELGAYLLEHLRRISSPAIREVRGRGLLIGVEIDPHMVAARALCEQLLHRGILSKDTHGTVLRFAPPLVISAAQIDWALVRIRATFDGLGGKVARAA